MGFLETEQKVQEQGSDKWLEERKNFIGASEIASVMRLPEAYETYEELLTKKILRKNGTNAPEFILNKGKNAEPVIKALYESRKGVNPMDNPIVVGALPYVRASLDGILEDRVVEFKLVGRRAFDSGKVPPHHYAQLQCQMWCAMKTFADYVMFDGEQIQIIEVPFDHEFTAQMVHMCIAFKAEWDLGVLPKEKTPQKIDDETLVILEEIEANKALIKTLTSKNDTLQDQVELFLGGQNAQIGDYKCEYVERKGAVEYKIVPELKNVDLEPYRKPSSKYLKISLAKK